MAKYLTDISIESEFSQEFSNGVSKLDFNKTTRVVQDIFWYLIPKKFEFDGIGKINIRITSTKAMVKYKQTAVGYAQYTFGEFDFENYFSLNQYQQNKVILKVLQKVITDTLKNNPKKANNLLEITNMINEMGFKYETEDKKLSKWNTKRNLRASILYKIDKDGENAYIKIANKDGDVLLNKLLIKNRVYDFYNNIYKTKWIDNQFQIITRKGDLFQTFSV